MDPASSNIIDSEKKSTPEYYLGVDWGVKKTGLAIADNETEIATGLEELSTGELYGRIEQLKRQYGISSIIIGTASHELAKESRSVGALKSRLEQLGLAVEFQEEFFSTKLAQQNLAQAEKKKISKLDNVEAARIILQSWLDK